MNIPGYRLPMPPPAPPCCGRAPNPLLPGTLQWPLPLLKEWFNSRADSLVDMTIERLGGVSGFYRLPDGGIPLLDLSNEVRTILGNKADKATTLVGYGIADAYTKTEVDSLVASAGGKFIVVQSLPAAATADPKAVYLVPRQSGESGNIFDEYLRVEPTTGTYAWEKIGSTNIDLSNYVQTTDSRLSNARTPTAHKSSHATGGADALSPADIGAAQASHAHPQSDVTGLADALAGKRDLDDLDVRGLPNGDSVASYHGKFTVDGVEFQWGSAEWYHGSTTLITTGSPMYVYHDLDTQVHIGFALSASGNYKAVVDGHTIIGYGDALAKESQIPSASTAAPQMDGTAAAGTSTVFARADHVHPKDTSKQDVIPDLADIRSGAAAGGTAVQPAALAGYATTAQLAQKADVSALRYDLGGVEVASGMIETDTTDPSNPIDYVELTLGDREIGRLIVDRAFDELRLVFPPRDSGKVRDFGLGIEVDTTLTAPALVLVQPSGEYISLVNPDGAMPTLADGGADASGETILYFSEVAMDFFLVKGEQVKEVA